MKALYFGWKANLARVLYAKHAEPKPQSARPTPTTL